MTPVAAEPMLLKHGTISLIGNGIPIAVCFCGRKVPIEEPDGETMID